MNAGQMLLQEGSHGPESKRTAFRHLCTDADNPERCEEFPVLLGPVRTTHRNYLQTSRRSQEAGYLMLC